MWKKSFLGMPLLQIAAAVIVIASFYFLLGSGGRAAEERIASIRLQIGKDGYLDLNVPRKFIGPSKLALTEEVVESKAPVKMIPLSFTYPGFKPLASHHVPSQSVFLMLHGGRGERSGLNAYVYGILQYNTANRNCHAKPYPQMQYGLHKYQRFYECRTASKYHGEDIYFYDAPSGSEQDVVIACPPPGRVHEKCRFYINIDDMGLVQSSFSAPQSLVEHWREIVADYRDFILPFYVDGIPKMKKPTPLSEAERGRIKLSRGEGWKP